MFFDIVRAAYLGEEYRLGTTIFKLSPRIARPYDFSRRTIRKADEYERLMSSLDSRFRDAARSDLYRRDTGWLDRGKRDCKIRVIEIDDEPHIIPTLVQEKTVAIDTSTINNSAMVLGICNIPDFQSAYTYLERHLALPKTHNHKEFRWSKLNPETRQKVLDDFATLLHISCNALLVIKTIALLSPSGKHENIFSNLIEGCFLINTFHLGSTQITQRKLLERASLFHQVLTQKCSCRVVCSTFHPWCFDKSSFYPKEEQLPAILQNPLLSAL